MAIAMVYDEHGNAFDTFEVRYCQTCGRRTDNFGNIVLVLGSPAVVLCPHCRNPLGDEEE